MKNKKDAIINALITLLTFTVILLFWTVSALSVNNKLVFPDISRTVSAMGELLSDGGFYTALSGTLIRTLIAFVASFIIAFSLAVITYKFPRIKHAVNPVIAVLRALPTVAVVLLILFWANGNVAPVIVSMTVVLPTVYTNCVAAFGEIDKDVIDALKLFRVPKKEIFCKVQLPQVAPPLLVAAGAGLSLNLKLMVAAEVLASTAKSLGNTLNYYNYNLMTANMLAVVLITVALGIIIETVFNALSKKAGKWQ